MQRRCENPFLAGLAHAACCGVPLLVIAVAAGAIALTAAAAIVVGVGALAILAALWWRRRRSCAPPAEDSEAQMVQVPRRAAAAHVRGAGAGRREHEIDGSALPGGTACPEDVAGPLRASSPAIFYDPVE